MMLFLVHFLSLRLHILSHPYVGTHYAAFADGDATKDGGVGINHHIIFQDRVASNTLDRVAILVERETLCSKRYTLVQLHVVANDTCGTYHHTCAMVDSEVITYRSLWMNVDTSLRMRHLCDDARYQWHSEQIKLVGYAIVGQCLYHRIASNDFGVALCCRVATISCVDISSQYAPNLR